MRFKFTGTLVFASVIALQYSNVLAAGIQKCQDEEGNWHYGDFADQACAATGDVTKLSSQGSVVGVEKPPPTQEELDQMNKASEEAAQETQHKKQQLKQDQSIVQIYGSEEVILATRDRKLESIDNNLDITRQLKSGIESDLTELRSRKQSKNNDNLILEREIAIQSYDNTIAQSLRQREELEIEYLLILKNFRDATARLNSGS